MAYLKDNSLRVYHTLKNYIHQTEKLRLPNKHKEGKLLISYIKPHKPVTRNIIARWIKTIDTPLLRGCYLHALFGLP